MPDEISFWVAAVETPNTSSTAFGATPEQALAAFVELWVERHCPASDAEAAYPWELKDGITIGKAVVGQAYMLSSHDQFWYGQSINGDDPRLAATWDALAEKYAIFPATIDGASSRLRQSFASLMDAVRRDQVDFGKEQPLFEKAMRGMASLVDEDPGTVHPLALAEAAENLRTFFDALRSIALMEPDPEIKKQRRELAGRYHGMSYDVARFSNAIAGMREASPAP
jgi:hypothetical protein